MLPILWKVPFVEYKNQHSSLTPLVGYLTKLAVFFPPSQPNKYVQIMYAAKRQNIFRLKALFIMFTVDATSLF